MLLNYLLTLFSFIITILLTCPHKKIDIIFFYLFRYQETKLDRLNRL